MKKAFQAIREVCGSETCSDLDNLLILIQDLEPSKRKPAEAIIAKVRVVTGTLRSVLAALLSGDEGNTLLRQLKDKYNGQ